MNNDYTGYFDYAAATPVDEAVLAAMAPFYNDNFYNPSALYLKAKGARESFAHAKHQIAQCLGARPTEVVITAGGSEANNLAIKGIAGLFPQGDILVSAIEHDSVLLAAQNFASKTVNVNNKGIINLTDLKAKISDKTVLVSVMLANNEVGSVQPIKEIASIINDIRQYRRQNGINLPIYLHTDACQAVNYLDINVARLGVDLMTINSAKIYGPKQVGALYIRAGVTVVPLVSGGGQEHGLRGGTENVAGTVGFATALIKATKLQKSEATRLAAVRDDFIKIILQGNIGATLNGPVGNRRLANNVHFTFAGIDNEYLLMQLDELGFQVAVGSACGASSGEPSHVLGAMGLGGEVARASLRVTFGKYTSGPMAAKLAQTIIGLVTAQ